MCSPFADAYLIPTLIFTRPYADYYVTFAKNHMVVVYTNQSSLQRYDHF